LRSTGAGGITRDTASGGVNEEMPAGGGEGAVCKNRSSLLLRREGQEVSPASVIEAVRLSNSLAGMRGRPSPGLDETLEELKVLENWICARRVGGPAVFSCTGCWLWRSIGEKRNRPEQRDF